MADARRETFIDAPVDVVWDLVGDVARHPEWWPRVVEVGGDEFERGSRYRQVTKGPVGRDATLLEIEELQSCEHLAIRCLNTGTYVRFLLTEAQGGTFVESRMGMDPESVRYRVFDAMIGQRYFRGWLQDTLEALADAAQRRARDESGRRVS